MQKEKSSLHQRDLLSRADRFFVLLLNVRMGINVLVDADRTPWAVNTEGDQCQQEYDDVLAKDSHGSAEDAGALLQQLPESERSHASVQGSASSKDRRKTCMYIQNALNACRFLILLLLTEGSQEFRCTP